MTSSFTWAPIADLPHDRTSLASPELRALSAVWADQRELLAGSESLNEFNDRLQRQWAIETGVIEHIYSLDRGTTEFLIEHGIDAALIPHDSTDLDPELVAEIIRDQAAAIEWVFEVVRGDREITTSFIKDLHALMTRHQSSTTGRDQFGNTIELQLLHGAWKELPNNPTRPGGTIHEYAPPEQVASEMDRLIELHLEHERQNVPPEIESAWLHHRFAQIHPFQDGNGRIARSLASLVLIRAGWFPLVITRDDRERYISALEAADAGDLAPLVEAFTAAERKAFVNALGIAREVLKPSEHVGQLISSVRDIFAARDESRQRELANAKAIADDLFEVARHTFGDVANKLGAQLGGFSVHYRFFADSEFDGGQRQNWYRWQTIEVARSLGYFASTRDYSAWVRLALHTETDAEIVLAFAAVGREYRGVIGASAFFFRREVAEGNERQIVDLTPISDEIYQVNYKEGAGSARGRFVAWIDQAVIRGLEMWRRGL